MAGTTTHGFETCCNALRREIFNLRPQLAKVGAAVDDVFLVVGEKDSNLPETMADMGEKIEEGFRAAGKETRIRLVLIKDAGNVCFIDGPEQFASSVLPSIKG